MIPRILSLALLATALATPSGAEVITKEAARAETLRVMKEDPEYFARLKDEVKGGLTSAKLECVESGECAQGDLMKTPGGVFVRLAEGGAIYPVIVPAEEKIPAAPDEPTDVTAPSTPVTEELPPVVEQTQAEVTKSSTDTISGGNEKEVEPQPEDIVPYKPDPNAGYNPLVEDEKQE